MLTNDYGVSQLRCAIYTRFSSDLQQDRSIDDQIRNCRRLAEQRRWTVLDSCIYSDRAVSGVSAKGRIALESLLKASSTSPRPFEYVLIDDTSRLSRKMGEVESILGKLRFFGIHVFFVSQGIDSRDRQSHLTVGVNSLIDSQYRRDLASKTLRGMEGQALKGYNAGGRVYGYLYTKEYDATGAIDRKTGYTRVIGSRPSIEQEQAAVVREIFTLFNAGLSMRDITHQLNLKGCKPPSNQRQRSEYGRPAWIPGTIRNILQNSKYMGDWSFNRMGWITNPDSGQRKRVAKDSKDWRLNEQPHLAIIDTVTWQSAQDRIAARKHKATNQRPAHRSSFLFSGLMRCHLCGGRYVLVTGSDRPNPLFGCCTNWQRGKAACSNGFRVSRLEIENVILHDIQRKLLTPPLLTALVREVNRKLKAKISSLKRNSSSIVAERKELATKLSNIIAAVEQGTFSPALQERLVEYETRIEQIDTQSELLDRNIDFDKLKVDEAYVTGWLDRMRGKMETDPMGAKAQLMSLIGEFSLEPETIDGIRYLRAIGMANIEELLVIAFGAKGKTLQELKYRGAGLSHIAG